MHCSGGLWSCEKIGIGRFPSLHHRKEGWPSDQKVIAKPPLIARPGWFSDENKRKTTPAASASVAARNFLDDAATPPCGDARRGITLDSNLFTAPITGRFHSRLRHYSFGDFLPDEIVSRANPRRNTI